jgi:NACHT domain
MAIDNESSSNASVDINQIIAQLTIAAAETSIKNAGSMFKSGMGSLSDIFTNIYRDYLLVTYKKVSTIKTFVNPQTPIDLYDNFVSLTLKNEFETINEIDLIENIKPGCRIVVSALAGRGKSVLMKYIALSKYHAPTGSIPLFLELRQINNISSKDFLVYLHNSYKGTKRLSYNAFLDYLKSGAFLLILDGFDEVSPDNRNQIEKQILDISIEYPKSSIIVSGRPDEKFNSWENFHHFKICPMTLGQVEQLIKLLDYDKPTKLKFLKQVKTRLFKSHESFLSTPLLATLMLLTFDQYADIPDKIHIFYDNAFETLFRKHDAMKEQYVRSTRSNLPVDVFRKVFSAFCAISYSESRFSFSREQLISDISKSLNYYENPCKPEQFLFDLVESVCLIQLEGFEYHFVHRSFQEYFCALFLAHSNSDTRSKFLSESLGRFGDNVVPMLFDMAQEAVEKEWVIRVVDRCIEFIESSGGRSIDAFLSEISAIAMRYIDENSHIQYLELGPLYGELNLLRRLYPAIFIGTGSIFVHTKISHIGAFDKVIKSRANAGDSRFILQHNASLRKGNSETNPHMVIALLRSDEVWLEEIGLLEHAENTIKALKEIKRDLERREKSRMKFLDGLF